MAATPNSLPDNIRFPAGNDQLHVPCYIDARELSKAQIDQVLDAMEHNLNGQCFRSRDLLLSVLEDQLDKVREPFSHSAAYLGLVITQNGTLRVSSVERPDGGCTIYARDQFLELATLVDPQKVKSHLQALNTSGETLLKEGLLSPFEREAVFMAISAELRNCGVIECSFQDVVAMLVKHKDVNSAEAATTLGHDLIKMIKSGKSDVGIRGDFFIDELSRAAQVFSVADIEQDVEPEEDVSPGM